MQQLIANGDATDYRHLELSPSDFLDDFDARQTRKAAQYCDPEITNH